MTSTVRSTRVAPMKALAFYSMVVTIPDDDVHMIVLNDSTANALGTYGHIFLSSSGSANHGIAWFRGSLCSSVASGTNFATSSSALTGTTGVDGKLTLGANGNNLYIENRTGSSIDLVVTLLTFNNDVD